MTLPGLILILIVVLLEGQSGNETQSVKPGLLTYILDVYIML